MKRTAIAVLLFAVFTAFVSIAVLLFVCAMVANAQQIDGSKHPEQIPDASAYRIFLNTVASVDGSPLSYMRQSAMVNAAHISSVDFIKIMPIIAEFKTRHDFLIADHKRLAEVGAHPDIKKLYADFADLVRDTRSNIDRTLSKEGASHFHELVMRERAGMLVDQIEVLQ